LKIRLNDDVVSITRESDKDPLVKSNSAFFHALMVNLKTVGIPCHTGTKQFNNIVIPIISGIITDETWFITEEYHNTAKAHFNTGKSVRCILTLSPKNRQIFKARLQQYNAREKKVG
jgi:hypothetical protein